MTRLLSIFTGIILLLAASEQVPAQLEAEPDVVVSAVIEESPEEGSVLRITATIKEGLHIYAQSQPKPFLATKITFTESSPGTEVAGPFRADREPVLHDHPQLDVVLHEFEGTVTWTAPLQIDDDSRDIKISGTVFAQACAATRCYEPKTYAFTATRKGTESELPPVVATTQVVDSVPPPVAEAESSQTLTESASSSSTAQFSVNTLNVQPSSATQSIWVVLPLSFLAGFLLNFMPCVLPVVGLKLLSFVQQAQSDRRRIFLMNVSYTAGLLSVMLVLASLAAFASLGWGEQFSDARFTIALVAIVFAFGLSFLGVWEIALPGFVSSVEGKAPTEGYAGAFSKGILSTLLATPCSGPLLGGALTWAVTQPAAVTYGVFVTVGLGMASPYLLVGLFPSLISVLPKPGNWMITFKYVMGFVMLGTVVYLLSVLPIPSVVPSVLLLLGIGAATWIIGRTQFSTSQGAKMQSWGVAAVLVMITILLSFGWLEGIMQSRFDRAVARHSAAIVEDADGISWQDYSPEALESAIASGRPVFVDFTADWCLTCKANEAAAVDTKEVSEAFRAKNVLALRADKTEPNPQADELLRKLGNSAASIPFYAVFNPKDPAAPVVMDGIFTSPTPFVEAVNDLDTGSDRRVAMK